MTSIPPMVPTIDPTLYPTIDPTLYPTMSPTSYEWPLQSLVLVIVIPSFFIMLSICIFYCYYQTNKNSLVHNEELYDKANNESKHTTVEHLHPIDNHHCMDVLADNSSTNDKKINTSSIWVDGFIYPSGNIYTGYLVEGKKQGRGCYFYCNGTNYNGEFYNDLPNGNGLFTYDNGVYYDGQWYSGKQHGEGAHLYPNGDKYHGHYYEGN
jgi:hypothetical protein